jgi:hypothetical protein
MSSPITKTWGHLESAARQLDYELFRTSGGVSVYDGGSALVTITEGIDDAMTDADLDLVLRAALGAALTKLGEVRAKYQAAEDAVTTVSAIKGRR